MSDSGSSLSWDRALPQVRSMLCSGQLCQAEAGPCPGTDPCLRSEACCVQDSCVRQRLVLVLGQILASGQKHVDVQDSVVGVK
jgi:hypothetical protein